eukprot:TRINITY_DN9146_c0_g1_i1.p1 TRINITY_DN9146_c0_g1~~TRINITY_DN9146_c0_g1_i1.p1  ORF type:complete len:811 (-),score=236.42 TRINITY_DN9146_c0_g1_i1:67-2280(-)
MSGDAVSEELILEMTDLINLLSGYIGQLVAAITAFFETGFNKDTKEAFSASIKNVGDGIKQLVEVGDETSRKRMAAVVTDIVNQMKIIHQSSHSPQQMEYLGEGFTNTSTYLVDIVRRGAKSTPHNEKKQTYVKSANEIEKLGPVFIRLGNAIANDPDSLKLRNDLEKVHQAMGNTFKHLVEAINIDVEDTWARIAEAINVVKRIIEAARDLSNKAKSLNRAIQMDHKDTIEERLQETMLAVRHLIAETNNMLEHIDDPVIRQFIQKQMEDVIRYAKEIQIAAQLALQGDPTAKQLAQSALDGLLHSAERVVFGVQDSQKQGAAEYPVHITSSALDGAAETMMRAAKAGDQAKFVETAKATIQYATDTSNYLEQLAEQAETEEERQLLLKLAQEIKQKAVDLVKASKLVLSDPSEENIISMENEHIELLKLIKKAREFEAAPPGFVPLLIPSNKQAESVPVVASRHTDFDLIVNDDDPPIVRAAKEQALAALQVLKEADKIAAGNPEMQRRLQELAEELNIANARLVSAAKLSAQDPDNVQHQQEFNNAQQDLNRIIQQIAAIVNPDAYEEELDMADESEDTSSNTSAGAQVVFDAANSALTLLEGFLDVNNLNPQEILQNAGTIASETKKIASALRKLAKEIDDPTFKEALISAAALISDNALKFKILAAVRASAGDDDDSDQLIFAAKGLKQIISEVVNDISALQLQHSIRNTQRQTDIIKKIAENVRRGGRKIL